MKEKRACKICGAKHHAKGLCREHYDQERYYSKDKNLCEGCGENYVGRTKRLCKSCIQKGIKGKLLKQITTGSGLRLWVKFDYEKKIWKPLSGYRNLREAELIRQDLITKFATKIKRGGIQYNV